MSSAPHIPLDLPRRVMRRALAVAALTLLAAVALGLARTDADIDGEVRAAMSLAATMERLARAGELSDAQLVAVLAARDDETPLRHLSLSLRDGTGRLRSYKGMESLHLEARRPVNDWWWVHLCRNYLTSHAARESWREQVRHVLLW